MAAGSALVAASCDFGLGNFDLFPTGPTGPFGPFPLNVWPARYATAVGDTVSILTFGGGTTVHWLSEHPGTASVDAYGVVTGLALGPATIRATSDGTIATAAITVVASTCSAASPAGVLEIGVPLVGELGPTDCSIPRRTGWSDWPVDYPTYTLPNARRAEGQTFVLGDTTPVRLDLTSAAFNPVLLLMDSTGWLIRSDHRNAFAPHLATILHPGTYTVWAASPGLEASGTYALDATAIAACTPADTLGVLTVGTTVNGSLAVDDCYDFSFGYMAHTWTVLGQAGTTLRVRVLASNTPIILSVESEPGARTFSWSGDLVYGLTVADTLRLFVTADLPGTYSVQLTTCTLPCTP